MRKSNTEPVPDAQDEVQVPPAAGLDGSLAGAALRHHSRMGGDADWRLYGQPASCKPLQGMDFPGALHYVYMFGCYRAD